MYRVITVAREHCSGGSAIARRVAERLGWTLLDKNLIAAVARAAQVDIDTVRRYDESVDSWWHRINRGGIWAAAIAAGASPADAQFFDAETMAGITQQIIEGAAAKGRCVIVGRGAQCMLQSSPDALHVFVYAPWQQRIARAHKRVTAGADIEDLLRSRDRTRTTYVRRYFGREWKDPHLYHMMISSQLGEEEVAGLIVAAVESHETVALSRPSGS